MELTQILGAVAHRGGIIVERETLRVGIAQMVSRTSGLQISVVAQRPADRRSTAERQAAIRAGDAVARAPRRLLPSPDEGMELRLGWLDSGGRAQWAYPQSSMGDSGGSAGEAPGPRLRATFELPPLFGSMTLLLAWPEIGFPETSIELALPDARTVELASVSIWDADLLAPRTPSWTRQVLAAPSLDGAVAEETCTAIASPRTLLRSKDAVLVLSWLSAGDTVLRATVTGVVNGPIAERLWRAQASPPSDHQGERDSFLGRTHPVFGIVQDGTLLVADPVAGYASGGSRLYEAENSFLLPRPAGRQPLVFAVGWSQAGLSMAQILVADERGQLPG